MSCLQVSTAAVQNIPIDDSLMPPDLSYPMDKRYIEDLCRRVSSILGNQSPLGKRDSTASSAGSETGISPNAQGPSFASLLQVQGRTSPISSLSTESSTESGNRGISAESPGVIRCESPLPESSNSNQLTEAAVKPCTPKAFKFYMEQHIENVIKHHKERQDRYFRVSSFAHLPPTLPPAVIQFGRDSVLSVQFHLSI